MLTRRGRSVRNWSATQIHGNGTTRVMSTAGLEQSPGSTLDIAWVRSQFPSLQMQVSGQPAAFLDGPAGTQVPTQVMHAIQTYLNTANANTCGAFLTSRRTDEMIAATRAAMADFFHCERDEVVFGQNMTTITFAVSRAIGRELKAGDEILLTVLDHDANYSPWKAWSSGRWAFAKRIARWIWRI